MRSNAPRIFLAALIVALAAASLSLKADSRTIYRTYTRTVVVERPVTIRRTCYERVVSRPVVVEHPVVVERVVSRPVVVHTYHHGLIPTVYRFIFGG